MVSFISRPLYPQRKNPPRTQWIRGWVGTRIGFEDVEKRPYRDSNSDPSAFQLVASSYTDCAILAPSIEVIVDAVS
jgi:hypothetical protein